jgi:hypothetical protein
MKRAVLLLALVVSACSREPGREPEPDAWAVAAAATHAEADRLLARGDRMAALEVLRGLVEGAPAPAGGDPEARRILLQDAYFRVASLIYPQGDPAMTEMYVGRGLALGDHGDLFAANLLVMRAEIHRFHGRTRAALDDYERALRINERLLGETLEPR